MLRFPSGSVRRLAALALITPGVLACGREERPATFPVRGELFVHAQPAVGAVVILHPVPPAAHPALWPAGYPRGYVAEDGSFTVRLFDDQEGAPAGKYELLVHWPASATASNDAAGPDRDEDAQDRLGGQFLNPEASPLRRVVKEQMNDWGRLELP